MLSKFSVFLVTTNKTKLPLILWTYRSLKEKALHIGITLDINGNLVHCAEKLSIKTVSNTINQSPFKNIIPFHKFVKFIQAITVK